MGFSELKKVNEEVFDSNSELVKGIKFGTPWVETLMLYVNSSGYNSSASKLMVDIASNFEEIEDTSKVIFDGKFKANRLPTQEEVSKAIELCKSRNKLSTLIRGEMRDVGVNFLNGLERKSMRKIIEQIDFEISSLPNFFYILGFQYLDNRNMEEVYGICSNGEVNKIGVYGTVYKVSISELNGIKADIFNMSDLFS